jgi:asparagine synthetase B (glutamine-hydrolysing)
VLSGPFTGCLDWQSDRVRSRLPSALAPHPATVLRAGPLQLATRKPDAMHDDVIVLLDGFLDNGRKLAGALGLPASVPQVQLLASAYRRFGRELPGRLRGDFALLVYDTRGMSGLLARDPLGVRCIYTHRSGSTLSFATELCYLLQLLDTRPAPDRSSVTHWVALSARPGPHTLYESVSRLDPGTMLTFERDGVAVKRFWEPSFEEPSSEPREKRVECVRERLHRAVAQRLAGSGERTGVLMSGGLDSASVAAVAARTSSGELGAYSGVFPDHPEVDESELIALLRRHLGLGGLSAQVRAGGLLAGVLEHLLLWQVPPLGWGDFWTLPLLRAAAAEGTSVILGGDGGDELFAARAHLAADEVIAGHPARALDLVRRLPGAGFSPPWRPALALYWQLALRGSLPYGLHDAMRRGAAPLVRTPRWLLPSARRALARSDDPQAWKRMDGPRWWAHTAHALTRGIEETGIFEHQRHRAASAGLAARHPMFDLGLLRAVMAEPPLESFDPYLSRPLLRECVQEIVPGPVRLRPAKAWFDSLIADCLTGPDGPVLARMLTGPDARVRDYLSVGPVEGALRALRTARGVPRFAAMHLTWRALTAECFLRLQESPVGETLPDRAQLAGPSVHFECHRDPALQRFSVLTGSPDPIGWIAS